MKVFSAFYIQNCVVTSSGYFVKNPDGDTRAIWWESNNAHQIDFTRFPPANWFFERIEILRTNPGVDGFKFDAGETDYAIPVRYLINK